jgi:NadR type nicotinamide-nucleotide adenylyltransferase
MVARAGRAEGDALSVLRVVVTGSESTGKTTLARFLATRYDTAGCPEFSRQDLEQKGAPLTVDDVEPIARGQRAAEDVALRGAHRLLFLDTDLLTTVLYARHYYGACPAWIEADARERRGDLYLLNHPDVPWEADGPLRDRGDRREEMHGLFKSMLGEFGARAVDVKGPWAERRQRALGAVEALLRDAEAAPRSLQQS